MEEFEQVTERFLGEAVHHDHCHANEGNRRHLSILAVSETHHLSGSERLIDFESRA